MDISKVHHIAIICSNYKISKKFYTEILGFKVLNEVYREERDSYKLDLCVGGQYQIELFSFSDPPKRKSFPEAAGLRHLAFAVTDIQEAVQHLKRCGIKTEPIRVDEITGKQFVFFQDPDGLPLELYED
ncbi:MULTISPECIES: VOC family protein [unclassified Bacillus (in: firmicutes)]|uniref:SMU1112c/YaeR family gloxylase I-like metalloprotein n=1 Tax=unclassified Bacillus (in: firmicutes) TaxID=185979 RepID=UPI00047D0676|nr:MULTISPECIES: VOC family protein [unclassified Bacillus (in: firmicutes)]SDZ22045.1 glyoxylase I family protein [Bacillus sp. 166amftsu]